MQSWQRLARAVFYVPARDALGSAFVTRRTEPADRPSCALVLADLIERLDATPLAAVFIRTKPELAHLREAAAAALAGASLARFRCSGQRGKSCAWTGLFPDRFPESFVCARCGARDGEALR